MAGGGWILLLALGFWLIPPLSTHAQVTQEQVDEKIDELVEQIYAQRNDNGIWDAPQPVAGHTTGVNWGGTTALMTFALLTAGESYQDPRLRPAIDFLRNADMTGTYAIAFRAHVWAALPDQFEQYLRRDTQWLINAMGPYGYDYTDTPRSGRVDNSVTQYGVLGVWEGAKRGVPVPDRYWRAVQEHFVRYQQGNGGWGYDAQGPVRGSMVAAGVAGLFVTQDYLHRDDFRETGRTGDHPVQRRIDRGLDWFAQNFRPDRNPGFGSHVHYYLYGVERIGLASGIRYFAGHDWYTSGAEYLLANPGTGADAAFSLMFLVRGGVPIFMNKLEIPDYAWNSRPRDLANLVAWASDETERDMMWQVVPIRTDPVTWLESPMLYVAGDSELELTIEQEQKLRRYVSLGGMLIFTADDNSAAFNQSVEELLERLFPDYPLEPIHGDADLLSMVYQMSSDADGLSPRSVHNGVRHLAIHLPSRDISWTLHRNDQSRSAPWRFFTNAYFYATERGRGRPRLETHFEYRSRRGGGPDVTVGRAVYDGNHDPEPLAWEVQSNFLFNREKANVTVEEVRLDALPAPSEMPFVHVAGTAAHEFTEEELESIRGYAEAGGLMLFENVGGRGDFARSANDALRELFGRQLRPASTQSALISGEGIDGFDVEEIAYRPYTVLRMGQITSPRLQTLEVDGDVRIIVSGEDLSKAMLDQPVWGVFGYSADSARRIVANMVRKAATTAHSE